jgi:hypothetical protein
MLFSKRAQRKGRNRALFKSTVNDVREDLELAVRVGPKAGARFNPVLVQDAQLSEAHMIVIAISKDDELLSVLTLLCYPDKTTRFGLTRQRRTCGMS